MVAQYGLDDQEIMVHFPL